MAFCSKCGTEIIDGAKFCPKCGTAVSNNNQATNEEQEMEYKERLIKPFDLGDKIFLGFLILLFIGGSYFGTRFYAPSIHNTIFGWFPYFESPSVVAYKYFDSIKEGNTVEMLNYMFSPTYPSRAKLKEHVKKMEGTQEFKDAINVLRMIVPLGFELEGGIKDFSIESEVIKNDYAEVTFEVIRKSGIKDNETIRLAKDENGEWGIKVKMD